MSSRRHTSNRSTNDQCSTVLSNTTDQAAQLKNPNSYKETWLQREVFVGLAPSRLKGADSEEEGRTVPTHLVQTVKLVGDARYCRCNDCHVESDEENGEDEGDDDESELKCVGVIGGCYS